MSVTASPHRADRNPRLWLLSIALLAVAATYWAVVGPQLVRQLWEWPTVHRDRDCPSYYLSAHRLLHGQDFYSGLRDDARSLGIADYFVDAAVSPPTFQVATAWLPLFPYPTAWAIWQLLSLAALGFALVLAVQELRLPLSIPGWMILSCLVLLFPPLAFHLLYAHTELFLLLMLVGSWRALHQGKEALGGALLGFAAALRLYPAFLLLYLIQRRKWKALLVALGSGLGLGLLAAMVAGPSSYAGYLRALRQVVPTLYSRYGNLSVWGSMFKIAAIWPPLGARPWLRDTVAVFLSLAVAGLTVWLARKRDGSLPEGDRAFGLYLVAALLLSPLSWIYNQVLLYLPILILEAVLRDRSQPARLAILVLALASAFTPFLGMMPDIPIVRHLPAFLPTLTPAGIYLSLALHSPPTDSSSGADSLSEDCHPRQ